MADDDEKYIVIPTSAVAQLSEVRLYGETWTDKISVQHSEVAELGQAAVVDTVANPTHVYDSHTNPGKALVFVSETNTYLGKPLRVPVKIHSGTSGRVITAYVSGGTYSGARLWSAKDE